MLKLFGKSTVVQAAVILAVTALLWYGSYADPQPMASASHFAPLYELLAGLNLPPAGATTIALVLTLVGAFFFNLIITKAGLASQNSLLPTLLFMICTSAVSPGLSPALIAGLIAIPFVDMLLLHGASLTVPSNKIFASAVFIGIATMVYAPSLTLVLAYALVAVNHRLYSWRDWMVFLLGLLAPFIPLWAVLFLRGGLADSFAALGTDLSSVGLMLGSFTTPQAVANATLLLFFAVSLFLVWRHMGEHTVAWQKNATTVMVVAVAAVATLPLTQVFPVGLQLLGIPFAFCATQRMSRPDRRSSTRPSWRDNLYDLLLIVIVIAAIAC